MKAFAMALPHVEKLNEHLRDVIDRLLALKRKAEAGDTGKRTQVPGRRGGRDYSRAPYIPPWTGGRGGFGGEGHGEAGGHSPGGTAGKPPGGGG